jgi:rhodanese-related sulfurtransferase
MQSDLEISPQELKRLLDAGPAPLLVDVREPAEYVVCALPRAELIPMNGVPARLGRIAEWARAGLVVVYCHHGTRSLSVVCWLREQGVANCRSLDGGIERWSLEIDRTVPRY